MQFQINGKWLTMIEDDGDAKNHTSIKLEDLNQLSFCIEEGESVGTLTITNSGGDESEFECTEAEHGMLLERLSSL